jgi:AraC family transcriptional regulator
MREAQSTALKRRVEVRTAGKPEPQFTNAPGATRKSVGPHPSGPLRQTSPKDVSILLSYLIQLPNHELWSGGRPLLTACTSEIRLAIIPSLLAGNAPTSSHIKSPHGIVDPVLVHFAAALAAATPESGEVNQLLVERVMLAVRAYLADKYGLTASPPRNGGGLTVAQLHAAKQLLTARIDESIAIADVALACGLSRQYFTKAFKAATGVPPSHWLQQYRVEMAMQLLGTTALPIAEIAIECGFADQSHFTRVFSRFAGSSPRTWRKQRARFHDRGALMIP